MTEFQFHNAAVELLPSRPGVSDENSRVFAEREHEIGISLPASVREWYSLEGAIEILGWYSNCDHPVPLESLGAHAEDWYGSGTRDFLQQNVLWFMGENQGVCNWAVALDGSDDPPVLVEVDSAPHEEWKVAAASFSQFIYCQIWDYTLGDFQCRGQDSTLRNEDVDFLRLNFEEAPTTYYWPGRTNYRFFCDAGRIRIWESGEHGADWFVQSSSLPRLEKLIRLIWNCGELSTTLYGLHGSVEKVLQSVRDDN